MDINFRQLTQSEFLSRVDDNGNMTVNLSISLPIMLDLDGLSGLSDYVNSVIVPDCEFAFDLTNVEAVVVDHVSGNIGDGKGHYEHELGNVYLRVSFNASDIVEQIKKEFVERDEKKVT